jgi:hypothetical protein
VDSGQGRKAVGTETGSPVGGKLTFQKEQIQRFINKTFD